MTTPQNLENTGSGLDRENSPNSVTHTGKIMKFPMTIPSNPPSFWDVNLVIQGMQQLETSKAELEVVEDELEAPWQPWDTLSFP